MINVVLPDNISESLWRYHLPHTKELSQKTSPGLPRREGFLPQNGKSFPVPKRVSQHQEVFLPQEYADGPSFRSSSVNPHLGWINFKSFQSKAENMIPYKLSQLNKKLLTWMQNLPQ